MAGDWMKVEKDTPEKPEVLAIASILHVSHGDSFLACFKFWRWADSHLVDGNARSVTESVVDALVGMPGFAHALLQVGWLAARNGSLQVPNFDRHMSQSAKRRALTANRVSQHKQRKGNAEVTPDALPEKRREDLKKTNKEKGEIEKEEKPASSPQDNEALKEKANALYREIDQSHFPWVALQAVLAVDAGFISSEFLASLVEQCKGGSNFGDALKIALGDHWMRFGELKLAVQARGIRWEQRWEKSLAPKDYQRRNGA